MQKVIKAEFVNSASLMLGMYFSILFACHRKLCDLNASTEFDIQISSKAKCIIIKLFLNYN